MKKLFFITVISILSIPAMKAQEVRIGAKGGVNFSTYSGDDLGDVKSRTGFHIGGLVEVPISERFSVQPEVLFSSQGAKYDEEGTEGGVDYAYKVTQTLDYIQVPVMAKFYVAEGFAIEAGPQVGFLASSKGEYEGTLGGVTVSGDEDLDNVSSIDVSLGGGLSYRLPMGVFFGARYNYGLTNLNDGDNSDNQKIHNNVLQLSAGYSF
ncbi:MAG: PorT family protein [Aequorivita sp.]|nr:PorT family protein [Aequorivita sp.]